MTYSYRIEQAIRAAAVLHKDQIRRGNAPYPYVTHLFTVAVIISDYSDEENVIIAGLLHDSIEDTDYTLEELQEDFGGPVRDIVESLSEPQTRNGERIPWKERKEIYLKQIKKSSEHTLIVAAADKIHNMRCIIEEYYEDYTRFIADFGGKLEDRVRFLQEISNILNRNLKNDIIHEFNHVFDEYKKFVEDAKKETEEKNRIA